ncbi:MAG TPA: TAXI family TRAP transporter solute-binding subunit [Stellaceae bacterium]|nr:TAXI family TRAP transporter solute-binding subunit [Stellaceae bacterium]
MRLEPPRRLGTLFLLGTLLISPAFADVTDARLALRAGKADSPYHALALELVGALGQSGSDAPAIAVEESQGSVQNVIDAAKEPTPHLFTTPPNVIGEARRGNKPYGKNPRYGDIRALFPIPFQTVHWVVRKDGDIASFADLAGHPFAPGPRGSFSERQTATVLKLLGLEDRAQLVDIDVNAAGPALASKQIAGFATAGTYPIAAVTALASNTPIRLLSLTTDQAKQERASDGTTFPTTIPGGTYPGVDQDTLTVALPAGIYTTRQLSNEDAYRITKAFWTDLENLAQNAPAWRAVTPGMLSVLGAKLHPGALKYYREAHIAVPAKLR